MSLELFCFVYLERQAPELQCGMRTEDNVIDCTVQEHWACPLISQVFLGAEHYTSANKGFSYLHISQCVFVMWLVPRESEKNTYPARV